MFLVNHHTGKAHFAELLPQGAREAVSIVAVAQLAQMFDRGVLAKKAVHGIFQHHLFVCQDQRHGSGSRQVQKVFGDDVELHLGGAALDGVGLGA